MANVTGFNTARSNSGERAQRAAASRISGFVKRYGEPHCNLARHAAFPLAITPNLLYQIWANFVPETPWIAVSHVLLSRLCRSVGYELFEMDIAVRNQLLAELKEQYGQQRFNDLAEFLQDYVVQQLTDDDPNTQELAQVQEWTALAYTKPGQMARELAEALSAQAKAELSEVFRLTSLTEILAEPLIEAGFEPLLIYSNGLKNYARGDQEGAIAEFRRLPGGWQQAQTAGVGLVIPDRMKAILEAQATVQESEPSKLYALLIGIDYYLPNKLPDGSSYKNLQGSVRDINLVEAFLKNQLGVPSDRIFKLTASNLGNDLPPPEAPEQLPTKENIVAAFRRLTEIAQLEDQIYIHCCDVGGRTKTVYPELKGEGGIDEALVPMDIGNSGNYLRDLEFDFLVGEILGKGADVTAILDMCHAGGMISDNKIIANQLQNYILLAACRANEYAFEYAFNSETKERNGVLTYWLMDTFKIIGTGITYQQLFNRIFAKIQSQFPQQTPQLFGDGSRIVFRRDRIQISSAATVFSTDLEKQMISLNAGLAQGIEEGQQFALYPLRATDFSQTDKRLAIVEVTECKATSSQASIKAQLQPAPIESGAFAIPISAGVSVTRKVYLKGNPDALEPLKAAIISESGSWLQLAENSGDETFDFIVRLTLQQEYEICHPTGQAVSHVALVNTQDEDAAPYTVKLLTHLAKYKNVQQLDNPYSLLTKKLSVELAGWQVDYEAGDRPNPQPFFNPSDPSCKEEETAFIRIINKSPYALNIVVISLNYEWSIEQIYPQNAPFLYFDPDQEMLLPLRGTIPNGSTEASDLIKVFATRVAAEFRWLELPPINQLPRIKTDVQQATDSQALAMQRDKFFEQSRITHRAGRVVVDPKHDWAVKQVSMRIQRF